MKDTHFPTDNPKDFHFTVENLGPDILNPENGHIIFPENATMTIVGFQRLCWEYGIDSGNFRFYFVSKNEPWPR